MDSTRKSSGRAVVGFDVNSTKVEVSSLLTTNTMEDIGVKAEEEIKAERLCVSSESFPI